MWRPGIASGRVGRTGISGKPRIAATGFAVAQLPVLLLPLMHHQKTSAERRLSYLLLLVFVAMVGWISWSGFIAAVWNEFCGQFSSSGEVESVVREAHRKF